MFWYFLRIKMFIFISIVSHVIFVIIIDNFSFNECTEVKID